jgi:hypothetical protein
MADSPFEIVTSGKPKRGSKGIIIGAIITVFLLLSVVAGVLLVRQQQNIQEKAASTQCPGAEQCPNSANPNLLQSCHPADTDGTTSDSLCNTAGRIETCGAASTQYCCPSVGAAWTTDMTACNVLASPTATATPIATATPTATPTPTPTATANLFGTPTPSPSSSALPTLAPTVQTTPLPVPVTGVDWPTVAGVGVGAGAIILSILIAL